MSDPINITATYDINTGRDRIEITDAIAAAIVRRALVHDDAVRAGIAGMAQRLDENTKPAAVDPPGHIDDRDREDWFKREITELRAKLATYENDRHHEIVKAQRDKALAELASTIEDAIEERNGYANENHFLKKERDAARAEADALRADAAKLRSLLRKLRGHLYAPSAIQFRSEIDEALELTAGVEVEE